MKMILVGFRRKFSGLFSHKYVPFVSICIAYYLLAAIAFGVTGQYWLLPFLLISQLGGHLFAGLLYSWSKNDRQSWSSALTGLVERTFFFVVVSADVSGAAISMIAWMTLKNIAYIGRFFTEDANSTNTSDLLRRQNITLLSSMLSLFFSMLGGLCVKLESFRLAVEWSLKLLVFA